MYRRNKLILDALKQFDSRVAMYVVCWRPPTSCVPPSRKQNIIVALKTSIRGNHKLVPRMSPEPEIKFSLV